MKQKMIKKIAVLAILTSMSVVFKTFSIDPGTNRISLFDTPLILAGIIAGPLWGMAVGFCADFIYSLTSGYSYSFIMMFSAVLWEACGGLFYHKKVNFIKLLVVVLITSILTTGINTIQLTIWYGVDKMVVGLVTRIPTMFIKWPITSSLVYVLYKRVIEVVLKDDILISKNI